MTGAVIMLIGLGIDALIGWPNALYAAIRHPVVWIGQVIGWLDSWLNLTETDAAQRLITGIVTALAVIALCGLPAVTAGCGKSGAATRGGGAAQGTTGAPDLSEAAAREEGVVH